jgi:hypothetical protein
VTKQRTWCYCPGCKRDLVSNLDIDYYSDTDLVRYLCDCGTASAWNFDVPTPVLVARHFPTDFDCSPVLLEFLERAAL